MSGFRYHLVDVFTTQPFGGNPLAVFPDGAQVPPDLYQSIAKELNLSETTFVLPPEDSSCHFKVRIFTPGMELPTAGHPTIGTSHVLTRLGMFDPEAGDGILRLEEGVGPVPVKVATDIAGKAGNGGKKPGLITMIQGLPVWGEVYEAPGEMAALLSLEESDLLPGAPIQMVSCGVPFWVVPLASLDAVRRATLRLDLWDRNLRGRESDSVFLFALGGEAPAASGHTVHSRMFAPGLGVMEDPATGIASGPLGSYLVRHGLVPSTPRITVLSEQGYEMGRPSQVYIEIETEPGGNPPTISGVKVGGHTVYMGGGTLEI
jgi:trans-2,3-dihydro-3-hydroxyanthranilate isomerase